jgi:O-antigen/teichoic acid export membrane protein
VLPGRSLKEFLALLQSLNKRHLREIGWLLFSNGASMILGLAIIRTIAKIGTVEYGKYALVLSIVPLANAVIYSPIDFFCQRFFYTFTYEGKKSYFLNATLRLLKQLFNILLILVIISFIGLKFFLHYDLYSLLFWLVSCGYILLFSSSVPLLSLINTMRRRKLVALFSVSERVCQLVFLLGVYYLVGLNASLVLLVFFMVAAVSFATKVKILKQEAGVEAEPGNPGANKLPQEFLQMVMSFGLPLLGFGVLAWLQTNGERWSVQLVLGLDSVGIFCFMSMVASTILNVVQMPLAAFIGPITWEKFADVKDAARVAEGMKLIWLNVLCYCLLIFGGSIPLIFFGKFLLTILGSATFASHSWLLPVIFVGLVLYTVGQGLTAVGFGFNQMRKYTFPKVSAAITTIFCYLGGAYYWGLSGVAWSLILTNIIYIILVIKTNKNILLATKMSSTIISVKI